MSTPDPRSDPSVAAAVNRRDQGRRRVSRTTRWVMAAAVAGSATLGTAYAHLIPGVHSTPSATTPGSGSGSSGTQGGLRSPGQAPGVTSQTPQTQSGAS